MNIEIANALSIYFETLYEMNRKVINVCGESETDIGFNSYKKVLDVIEDIPKMIPYCHNKKTGRLSLSHHDGLLEFKEDVDFLERDYREILQDHKDFLNRVRKIRNKIEHKMHAVKNSMFLSGSSSLFHYDFKVENNIQIDTISIDAEDVIRLLKDLNILFSKLQCQVKMFAEQAHKTEYPYYQKLCRFDFLDFNRIYESNLLELVGKIQVNF